MKEYSDLEKSFHGLTFRELIRMNTPINDFPIEFVNDSNSSKTGTFINQKIRYLGSEGIKTIRAGLRKDQVLKMLECTKNDKQKVDFLDCITF